MATHVYLENIDDIEKAYTFNALPVKAEELNEERKLTAISDPEKHYCYVIGGDCASQLENQGPYWFNVIFVENNCELDNNVFANHFLDCAAFYEDDSFKDTDKAYAYNFRESKDERDNSGIEESNNNDEEFIFDEIAKWFNNIGQKVTEALNKIFNKKQKLLTKGSENDVPKENTSQARKEFADTIKPEAYIQEGVYSKEQAENAQRVSDNPLEFLQENNPNNNGKGLDEEQIE